MYYTVHCIHSYDRRLEIKFENDKDNFCIIRNYQTPVKNKSLKSPKFPGIRGGPAIRVVLTPNITLKRYNSPVLTNNNCAKFYEDAIVPNMPFKSLDIAPSVVRITGVDKGGPGGQAPPNDRANFFS